VPPMPTIHFDHADGHRVTIQGMPRQSLMKAAVAAGIDAIAADCGGTLSCATCHVMIDEPWRGRLPAPSSDEDAMLELTAAPREPGSRLSCQVVLDAALDGLVVRLPARQY
jgi:ferredoxin, 2Fe-2S